jgi:hypothetical protein
MWKNGTEKARNKRRRKLRHKNPAKAKRDEKAVSGQFWAGPFLFCVPAVQWLRAVLEKKRRRARREFQEHGADSMEAHRGL